MRTIAFAIIALALAVTPAHAQKNKVPKRPALPAEADTNDANAYYQFGLSQVRNRPGQAADAFYWAIRLAPPWADPYYARRTALLLERRNSLWGYLTGQKGIVTSKQVRAIDSLTSEALVRNPFFASRLEWIMINEAVMHEFGEMLPAGRTGDAGFDAFMAYAEGRYDLAARLYGELLRRRPRDHHLRAPRARALFHQMQYDSAANELTILLTEMRKQEQKELVYYYDSKELFEYSLGRIYYLQDRYDDAKAALGRALEEDLSFYMAHVDLAEISLKQGDTTTALSELALATELRGTDAAVRLRYGDALYHAKRYDEAVEQYRAAITQEPYFAQPYFHLARALDESGKSAEAAEIYRAFVARSPRGRSELEAAKKRLAELAAATPGSTP